MFARQLRLALAQRINSFGFEFETMFEFEFERLLATSFVMPARPWAPVPGPHQRTILFFLSLIHDHRLLGSWCANRARTTMAPFRSLPNSKFLHSLSITLILEHMHGAVNVCKKNN
jgi:hypothetical protein